MGVVQWDTRPIIKEILVKQTESSGGKNQFKNYVRHLPGIFKLKKELCYIIAFTIFINCFQ